MNFLSNIKNEWHKSFLNRKFLVNFIISSIALIAIFMALSQFLQWIELRQGVVLDDPILNLLPVRDVSLITFGVLYLCLISALISLLDKPNILLLGIISYSIIIILRMTGIYFVALDPPALYVPLMDPITETFASGKVLSKDLFFSGHTATMWIIFLLTEKKVLKFILFFVALFISTCVLIQHVHYTIDVLVAPLASYSAYKIAQFISRKIN
jgi:membrane-associated phospholipid phosphatase